MLDDRKLKVLYAIINSHIMSAEPIGSRTISKDYDLGVSSATIRNEMADLEDQGYLNKPHSSSGRVPSDKAYRLYVDEILKLNNVVDEIKKERLKEILFKDSLELEDLIQNSVKILSGITSYTSLVISPHIKRSRLHHIQLIKMGTNQVLMVLVSDSGLVKNSMFRVGGDFTEEELQLLSNFLNLRFKGLNINEIIKEIEFLELNELNQYKNLLQSLIPVISQALDELEDIDLYSDGLTNILNFPEYKDLEKAKSFMSFIENKDLVIDLMMGDEVETGMKVTIGEENIYEPIKDCSLVTADYKLGDKTIGKIGIIGPMRMDYLSLINTLNIFSLNISEILQAIVGE